MVDGREFGLVLGSVGFWFGAGLVSAAVASTLDGLGWGLSWGPIRLDVNFDWFSRRGFSSPPPS